MARHGLEIMTPAPHTINEPAILQYANAVLNTNYTSLDGISDQELNRVWVIVQLDVLVQDYEVAAFMCKTPDEVLGGGRND